MDSVRKHIEEAFRRARLEPATTSYTGDATIEVVQQIAEPQEPRLRRVQYSTQSVYHIPEPKPELLSTLFDRAVKSLKY
jgi:hypothetical protein